ncbi:hypothetical protein [Flavobacterium sp.]|uniref:hypothetical protein n=1 Tax=Flavobacterium sp. TaxID=239 RepID=UPI0037530E57
MKHFIKMAFYLLSIISIFGMSSCERDLYEDKIYQSKVNVEKVSLKDNNSEVNINKNLFKAVSKIKKYNNDIAGKIVYDSINNIYFDDESGIKITKDDYESYTFKIIKDDGNLENLLFIKNQLAEFDVYKVYYSFTEEEMKTISQSQLQQSETTYIDINDKYGIPELICIDIMSLVDNGEVHGADTPPTYVWVVTGSICGWVGGGGGGEGSSGGDGGSSGGGTSGGNSNNGGGGGGEISNTGGGSPHNNSNPQILTSPVHGGPKQINHLAKLKAITDVSPPNSPPNILRNKIMQYHYSLPNATQENGVEVRKNIVPIGSPQTYSFINPLEVGYDYTKFGDPNINTIMYIHLHHTTTQTNSNGQEKELTPVFSDGDLTQFAKSFNQLNELNASDKNNLTSILVSKNGVFAMRVGDDNELLGFNDWLNTTTANGKKNSEIFNEMFYKNVIVKSKTKAIEIYNSTGGTTQAQLDKIVYEQLEKWFIKFIQNFNQNYGSIGIFLFKGTIQNGQITWSQLTTLID